MMFEPIKNNEREKSFRTIIEVIKNTLDINKTKNTIIEIVGKTLGADRCFIVDYDKNINRFLPIDDEYLSSKKILSCKGQDVHEIVPGFIDAVKNGKYLLVKNREIFLDTNKQDFQIEQETFEKYGVSSIFAVPLFYQKELLGVLSIHYVDKNHEIDKFEINLIKDVANQTVIAIHQAHLYKLNQIQAEREHLLRKVIETSRNSLILEHVLMDICKEIVDLFKVQGVSIGKIPQDLTSNEFVIAECKNSKNTTKLKDVNNFGVLPQYLKNYLLQVGKTKIIPNITKSDLPENIIKIYEELGIKSMICVPLKAKDFIWGGLYLSKNDYYSEWGKDDIELLETIATQIYIAIRQSELYEKEKKSAKREALLRNITETIRSTLDIDKMQKIIVMEIAKALNADRCFIIEYNQNTNKFLPVKVEYLLSSDVKSIIGFDVDKEFPELAKKNRKNEDIIITDIDEYLLENNFLNTQAEKHFMEYKVKSGFSLSIFHTDQLIGVLAIQYVHRKGIFIEEEVQLVKALASQMGIAINQAKLFENEKIAKEREKLSRNIVEILRSSMDKTMIKKLFVKNIRKFFDADRVYLSDYDFNKKMYLPVNKDSEYLSNYKEKSFVGYNWYNQEAWEYIQPLLEKEELNIFCWDEYILQNKKSQDFIDLFESSNVKSSYNFPVLYYQNIMGFLSINFTDNVRRLSVNDINKIRDICTQVGIALYQAELYLKAQQCSFSKELFIEKLSKKIEEPVNNILKASAHLSQNKIERAIQIKYLNSITINCNKLIESTKDISDD